VKRAHADLVRYRAGFALIVTLLLVILTMLPFSVASMLNDVLGRSQGHIFPVSAVPHSAAAATHAELHVAVTALDELGQSATLRVSGHHVCRAACDWSDRVIFFALAEDESLTEGLPPSASVTLPPTTAEVTQTVQLPIYGQPIRYPFDTYEFRLGVVLQRILPDGTVQSLTPAEAAGHLFMTFQEQLSHQTMAEPVAIDPRSVPVEYGPYEYLLVLELQFSRPLYLQILTVLLVLMIAASAAYAVFMRPLQDLVVNSGALMLGIWGIRSILTPSNLDYVTAVDLSLSVVLLFLLSAITVRALLFVHDRGELHLLDRWLRK
jgi:hypothetical protein